MNKKLVYFALALLIIGFLLVESSMYILPYIEGFKELELAVFIIGILLLVGVIVLLEKTKERTDYGQVNNCVLYLKLMQGVMKCLFWDLDQYYQVLFLLGSSALLYSFVGGFLVDVVEVHFFHLTTFRMASSTFMSLCVSVGE